MKEFKIIKFEKPNKSYELIEKSLEENWGGNAYEYALTLCLDTVIKL